MCIYRQNEKINVLNFLNKVISFFLPLYFAEIQSFPACGATVRVKTTLYFD